MATISSNFFTGKIALHVQLTAKLPYYALHILTTDALSLFIRAGNYWWVSHQMGEEDGFMRAEVGRNTRGCLRSKAGSFPQQAAGSHKTTLWSAVVIRQQNQQVNLFVKTMQCPYCNFCRHQQLSWKISCSIVVIFIDIPFVRRVPVLGAEKQVRHFFRPTQPA